MSRRGATLLELVLVMMVIFTLAMVVAPRFSDFVPSLRVKSAANALFATAGKARADAVLTGARHRLVIDAGARSFWIAYEPKPVKEPGKFEKLGGAWPEEELPMDVEIQAEGLETDKDGKRYVEFRPDGGARQASITVANDRGDSRVLKINAATGAAKIETPEAAP
jgi:Tfp pilus assembly protein FimT